MDLNVGVSAEVGADVGAYVGAGVGVSVWARTGVQAGCMLASGGQRWTIVSRQSNALKL